MDFMPYRRALMRLRALQRHMRDNRQAQIDTLNRFYDAQALPPDLRDPEVVRLGEQTQKACNQNALKRRSLSNELFDQQVHGLSRLGAHFGALAAQDGNGSVRVRFLRYWTPANRTRREQLDGIDLHGQYDHTGPMFIAFAKAFGYPTGQALAKDLQLEVSYRRGECRIDMDVAARIGLY